MRFVIYGVGAIGGTLAVCLSAAGFEVIGIARGAQLDAIKARGLTVRTPQGDVNRRFPVVAAPSEITFGDDDLVVLAMKSQDCEAALLALRTAGVDRQTIACFQNGVASERMAARYFENVLGVVVMMPATFLTAGEIVAGGTPRHGLFDIGRFPSGTDGTVDRLCEALNAAGFAAFAHHDVMRGKYGKLLLNLGNGIDAVLGSGARDGRHAAMARAEGEAVYAAAGIAFDDVGAADPRRQALMHPVEVPGTRRIGSSAAQSLARGAGSIETDYLNGEIVLLGRLHGVPAPVNALLAHLAAEAARKHRPPGSMTEAEFDARLGTTL
jgi:2-dehydropantoate 2-reductase